MACPLSTLLAHLSVLESQAEEVVQVGDRVLWPELVAKVVLPA